MHPDDEIETMIGRALNGDHKIALSIYITAKARKKSITHWAGMRADMGKILSTILVQMLNQRSARTRRPPEGPSLTDGVVVLGNARLLWRFDTDKFENDELHLHIDSDTL